MLVELIRSTYFKDVIGCNHWAEKYFNLDIEEVHSWTDIQKHKVQLSFICLGMFHQHNKWALQLGN